MPTIVAASESQVLLDTQPIEGVQSVDYRHVQGRTNVYGIGSTERIGVVSGHQYVEGVLRVASTCAALDGLALDQSFSLSASLKRGKATVTVSFDECYLTEKSFGLTVGQYGEATYTFSATRVREEVA